MCGCSTGTESLEMWNNIGSDGLSDLPGQGLEGAARVIAMQSSLRVNESLLKRMLFLIFMILPILYSFYMEMLYTVLDGGAPRVMLLGMLSSVF